MKKWAALSFVLTGITISGLAQTAQSAGSDAELQRSAQQAMEKGDFATAETLLLKLSAEDPKDAQVLYDLGMVQEQNGKEEQAASSYRAAMEADPKMIEPQIGLGLLDARAGRIQRARKELIEATNLLTAPPELRARAYRALAQMDAEENPSAASDELLRAINLTGETRDDTLLSAELAERSGALDQAEAAYLKELGKNPDDVDARVGLGHVLKAENKLSDAEAVLRKGVSAHPDDVRLNVQLASVLMAEQKTAEAIPLLEKLRAAVPAGPDQNSLTDMLAHLYAENGDLASAEKLDREALEKTPNDPRLQETLGSLLIRESKFAEAETILHQAASQRTAFDDDKAWAEAAGHLAFAASRNEHPQLVLQALAARSSVLPETPATLFLAATANDTLHQNKEAIRLYKAFLSAANGKFPTEEFQARHRVIALERTR